MRIMRMVPRLCVIGAALLYTAGRGTAAAEEVYAVRVLTTSFSSTSCLGIFWSDDLEFHNPTAADLIVRLLDVSNGPAPASPVDLSVPAGRTVSASLHTDWQPVGVRVPIWVVRLEVPKELVVQSRAEAHSALCTAGTPPSPVPDGGVFQLPLSRGLTPAGKVNTLLGADLGGEASHVNVGIYNGGSAAASATVEMHQGCDDTLLDHRVVTVPPNSVVQLGGVGAQVACPTLGGTSFWVRYVTVTVDQPSFSYIVNKMDELPIPPVVPYLASIPQ